MSAFARPLMRGDVYWVELPPRHTKGEEQRTNNGGPRPWVIVSAPAIHLQIELVIGVPLTTKTHKESLLGDPVAQITLNMMNEIDSRLSYVLKLP